MNQSGRDAAQRHRIGKRQRLPQKSAAGNEEISSAKAFHVAITIAKGL